jgi:predicted nucleic acid-binding protein
MKDSIFLDTNILVYAYDLDAGVKHDIAMGIVERMWHEKTGIISVQVLQEFYITITRKILQPLSHVVARGLIQSYLSWTICIE